MNYSQIQLVMKDLKESDPTIPEAIEDVIETTLIRWALEE